ncbi:MAG: sigma 54-interacting transcriptional regulator [Deltaproteobacteria bacterium]|nr:sigma 54-interacting transcriptional regulator [Deltaproteobacteria bacterium]MBW1952381.1 sigma 54-interacting transcriptional regulator [Deltaproteobacteria bacterium]MBW1985892.1 sigma 54-interacting transcriptional regulator [Deltaproteobacteria bacterium]MBW2133652.1 sigma 54-interacting transcriptional regulator [Deltaproteobacteria bacterium]
MAARRSPSPQITELILDSLAEGVFTVDKDFTILSFNAAAEEITGISRQDALGQKCYEVLRANICQQRCPLEESIASGRARLEVDVDILDSQGRRVPLKICTTVLKNQNGQVIGGVETFRDLSALESLRKELTKQYTIQDILAKSPAMQDILAILPDLAPSDATVLLEGESGTGKNLVSRALHELSHRQTGPYVVVNCSALPDPLLESELFGYVKGAFTDAKQDKPGRFAAAQGGTLLLDEVGELSPAMQVKLLRVLDDKEYVPLGSNTPIRADVRVIAATNKVLKDEVRQGRFRPDLYYRLNVVRLRLPPLRQRREDIPLLVDFFIRKHRALKGKRLTGVTPEVLERLLRYEFPGNVRELENIIEHGVVLCRGERLELRDLPEELRELSNPATGLGSTASTLAASEARLIADTLAQYQGQRGRTAQALGIAPSTLWRKMQKYGLLAPASSSRHRSK